MHPADTCSGTQPPARQTHPTDPRAETEPPILLIRSDEVAETWRSSSRTPPAVFVASEPNGLANRATLPHDEVGETRRSRHRRNSWLAAGEIRRISISVVARWLADANFQGSHRSAADTWSDGNCSRVASEGIGDQRRCCYPTRTPATASDFSSVVASSFLTMDGTKFIDAASPTVERDFSVVPARGVKGRGARLQPIRRSRIL
jgi:hypothetical protein